MPLLPHALGHQIVQVLPRGQLPERFPVGSVKDPVRVALRSGTQHTQRLPTRPKHLYFQINYRADMNVWCVLHISTVKALHFTLTKTCYGEILRALTFDLMI